ncbi:MAG: hypothetical protein K0Q66_2351 [Chitinophagaceae bacterium]|jgi:hypothetical protein|nr:hypothetical protein [Chitinophagaceae bacterium]
MRFLLILALVSVLYSQPVGLPRPAPNTDTWVPIYTSSVTSRQVSFQAPRPIVTSGKIYTFGSYLLQVEKDSGIHVIDYSNRTAPVKTGFIRSMLCSEMAVKGQQLYINNFDDLVILDISNMTNPVEVARVPKAFNLVSTTYPPWSGFFECTDPAKGMVVGWKKEKRDYPKCYR